MQRRTTVRLDAGLLREAKRLALDTDRTLTAVIADALTDAIARARAPQPLPDLPVSRQSGGLRPGVSLQSYAKLLDYLDTADVDAGRKRPHQRLSPRRRAAYGV